MHTTKITRTLALAGCAPAGKLSHLYGGLLPVLALLDATLGKLKWGQRACAVLVLCAANDICPIRADFHQATQLRRHERRNPQRDAGT